MTHSNALKGFKSLLPVTALVFLSACGGSSSSGDKKQEVETQPQLTLANDSVANVSGRAGAASLSILNNDTVDSVELTIEQISISVLNADLPLSLNEDGTINVAPMTAAGTYTLEYQVCLQSDADVCESGVVSVEVLAATLELMNDSVQELNGGIENTNIVNVLTNDLMDGTAIMANDVTVTVIENIGPLEFKDSEVSLGGGINAGDYSLTYQVCENLNPENCAQANAQLNVNKGVFMQGAQGIKYESDSAIGFTDENGGYIYSQGDSISFHIGGTPLGEEVTARANMSPLTLITDATLPVTALEVRKFLLAYENNKFSTATEAMLNVLTLLYSLDKDKDASNGIVIDEAIHDALALTDLNIYQRTYLFSGSKLSIVLHDAFNKELIDNASKPEFFVALDNFYNVLNISPQVYTASKDWSFTPGDESTYIYEVSYDQETQQVFWDYFEVDTDNKEIEGTRGRDVEVYNNNLQYVSWESYFDGVLDSKGVNQRDIHGKELSYQNLSEEVVTYQTQNTHNEQGLVIEHKRDSQGDDFYEYVTSYEYDADGNMTKKSQDNDGDGDLDTIYIYTYTNGLLTKNQDIWDADYDEDAINIIDFERVYTYNEFGDVSKRVETNYSNNTQKIYDFIFDEHGNHIFTYIDDWPEVEGYNQIVTFTYDDKGNKLSQYSDSNGDGNNEYGYVYQYDAQNNIISQTNYQHGNMVNPSSVWTQTYDEHGNELTNEHDNNGDGTINYGYLYIYNENGNQIEQQRFDGPIADGVPASHYFIEYQLSNFKEWYVIGY